MDAAGLDLATMPSVVEAVHARVDSVLASFLADRRAALVELDPAAADLVDELSRLVAAGGKRIRPAFCFLGYRAAGGLDGDPIVRAAAALELFHTFALVHDDVMDETPERRGVQTTQVRFAPSGGEPFGRAVAILVGDLAAVLAESLFRASGFPPERMAVATQRFDRMRLEMAAGQYLDLEGVARQGFDAALHVAELKTGSYTVEGPLLIGAALAGAPTDVEATLLAYGRPAGEAFQLRDDLVDGDASPGIAPRVNVLVETALRALDGARLEPVALDALRSLVRLLRVPEV